MKLQKVCAALGLALDEHVEPYATVARLRTVRNAMAHGQPEVREFKVTTRAELDRAIRTPCGEAFEPEQVLAMCDQLMGFRKRLFAKAGISPAQTWDSAFGGY
ncbi:MULTISPECIES: hypothetical protein [Cupriavidus]